MIKTMLFKVALGFTMGLAVAGQRAAAASECADCTAPNSPAPTSRDEIRAARASDAKRIADEPSTRPWDGIKLTAPPSKPRPVK